MLFTFDHSSPWMYACRLIHQAYLELAVLLLTSSGQIVSQASTIKEAQATTDGSSANRESAIAESDVTDDVENNAASTKPESPKPGRRSKKPKVAILLTNYVSSVDSCIVEVIYYMYIIMELCLLLRMENWPHRFCLTCVFQCEWNHVLSNLTLTPKYNFYLNLTRVKWVILIYLYQVHIIVIIQIFSIEMVNLHSQ